MEVCQEQQTELAVLDLGVTYWDTSTADAYDSVSIPPCNENTHVFSSMTYQDGLAHIDIFSLFCRCSRSSTRVASSLLSSLELSSQLDGETPSD